jgi:hypothetical protein
LLNGLQHIAGLGDLRQINLGLDLIGGSGPQPRFLCRSRFLRFPLKVLAHALNHVGIERARMALLIVDADGRQVVENRLAFDFQFSGQIVNANFIHSVLCCFLFAALLQLFLLYRHVLPLSMNAS